MPTDTTAQPTDTTAIAPLVLTRDQVAEQLQVPPDTIENLHRTHQLKGVKIGRHLRWTLSCVEKFVAGLTAEDET